MASAKTYHNLIGGDWVAARSQQTHPNLNPADNSDVVGLFDHSQAEEVDRAVEAAEAAFEKWRLVPAPQRAEVIFRTGELLKQRKEQYAREMTREMGKVLKETRGDVQEAIDTAYFSAA